MKKTTAIGLLAGMLVAASGCATNSLVSSNTVDSGVYYGGSHGTMGHSNTRTIEQNSRLDKISIIGDGNTYFVENDVRLRKIEIFGENNTVSIPENLVVQWSTIGEGNQLIRRPVGAPAALTGDPSSAARPVVEKTAEDMPATDDPKSP